FFPGQNPIGQHFGPGKIKYSGMYEIAGGVSDIRYMTYEYQKPVRPMFWLPETQSVTLDDPAYASGEICSHYVYNIVICAPGSRSWIDTQVRNTLAGVDPSLVLYSVDRYTKVLSTDFQRESLIANLTTRFGVLGLVLASVGLYGVLAYTVQRRTAEIGVR